MYSCIMSSATRSVRNVLTLDMQYPPAAHSANPQTRRRAAILAAVTATDFRAGADSQNIVRSFLATSEEACESPTIDVWDITNEKPEDFTSKFIKLKWITELQTAVLSHIFDRASLILI